MAKHELYLLMENKFIPHPVTGEMSNEFDGLGLPNVSPGTSIQDVTLKDDRNVAPAVVQVKVFCPDDASRDAYEALDGTRYSIVSAETIPDAPA